MKIYNRVSSFLLTGSLLLTIGSGCLPWQQEAPAAETAEVVDFKAGSTITVGQNWFGITTPSDPIYGKRQIVIDDWQTGLSTKLSWTLKSREETVESVAARAAASKVPVGQIAKIPDPVYVDIDTEGSITTDALGNAERILLPAYWPTGDYDVNGEQNSLLWLSKAQYDELVTERESHIALGLFDSSLQNVLNFGSNVTSALDKLQGKLADGDSTSNTDITKLTAAEDWGSYELLVNGVATKVRTVKASSKLADYVVLANPENPLILKVSIKPLSLGFTMLSSMSLVKSLAGYTINSVSY
jgi:hypothetical protein